MMKVLFIQRCPVINKGISVGQKQVSFMESYPLLSVIFRISLSTFA